MNLDEKIKQDFILLGLHIRKLREERILTIKELAEKTGLRPQYLQKIEKDIAYGMLFEKHLIPIAKAFDIKLSELFKYK